MIYVFFCFYLIFFSSGLHLILYFAILRSLSLVWIIFSQILSQTVLQSDEFCYIILIFSFPKYLLYIFPFFWIIYIASIRLCVLLQTLTINSKLCDSRLAFALELREID